MFRQGQVFRERCGQATWTDIHSLLSSGENGVQIQQPDSSHQQLLPDLHHPVQLRIPRGPGGRHEHTQDRLDHDSHPAVPLLLVHIWRDLLPRPGPDGQAKEYLQRPLKSLPQVQARLEPRDQRVCEIR